MASKTLRINRWCRAVSFSPLLLFIVSSVLTAQVTLVTTRTALGANNSLDWGSFGVNGGNPPNPLSVVFQNGTLVVTASDASVKDTDPFELLTEMSS
jgi:hypothetical protein